MTETRVDVLSLCWYVDRRNEPEDVAERWLAACREHFPAALPRRFGPTEPLRGRMDRDGDDGFVRAHAEAGTMLFHAGTPPAYGGSLGARPETRRLGPMTSHSLDVALGATDGPGPRELFVAVAEKFGVVFASGSVRRDLVWTGRTLYIEDPSTTEPYLAPLGQWLGLPPSPPEWAWFGAAYRRLVDLPAASGDLHVDLDTWVPPALVARLGEVDPARRPAARMPRTLRRPWWRFAA